MRIVDHRFQVALRLVRIGVLFPTVIADSRHAFYRRDHNALTVLVVVETLPGPEKFRTFPRPRSYFIAHVCSPLSRLLAHEGWSPCRTLALFTGVISTWGVGPRLLDAGFDVDLRFLHRADPGKGLAQGARGRHGVGSRRPACGDSGEGRRLPRAARCDLARSCLRRASSQVVRCTFVTCKHSYSTTHTHTHKFNEQACPCSTCTRSVRLAQKRPKKTASARGPLALQK